MKKIYIILSTIIIIIAIFGTYQYIYQEEQYREEKSTTKTQEQNITDYRCSYNMKYDSEMNQCVLTINECQNDSCAGVLDGIQCEKSKEICGENIICTCTEKDNSGWVKIK
jgi:hypothetical protein